MAEVIAERGAGQPDLGIDTLDPNWYVPDPHDDYKRLRDEAPLYWDAKNELWAVTRHEDVMAISRDATRFCNGQGFRPGVPILLPMMLGMDDPEHKLRRKLVSYGFTPRRVAEREAHIRQLCTGIIDEIAAKGSCDFTADVAVKLPMYVIAERLGIKKEDYRKLAFWSDRMTDFNAQNPTGDEDVAFGEFWEYITAVIADRRQMPKEDLISVLTHAVVDGEILDDDALVFESLLILIGGNETTRNVISGAMDALIQNPDQYKELQDDPSLLATAVEEFMRWVTPIISFIRTATEDVELHGQTIREGDTVLLLYSAANRDERAIEDPMRFDIHRSPNPHVAFGFGPHFCMGASLARLEVRVLFEELLRRLPDIRLAPGAEVERHPSSFIRSISAMPVEFTPEPA